MSAYLGLQYRLYQDMRVILLVSSRQLPAEAGLHTPVAELKEKTPLKWQKWVCWDIAVTAGCPSCARCGGLNQFC